MYVVTMSNFGRKYYYVGKNDRTFGAVESWTTKKEEAKQFRFRFTAKNVCNQLSYPCGVEHV